jgi:hypothetical protein
MYELRVKSPSLEYTFGLTLLWVGKLTSADPPEVQGAGRRPGREAGEPARASSR